MSKLVIYQKNQSKPIIISDKDQDKEQLGVMISSMLSSFATFYKIKTENDCLFINPKEIQSVLITDALDDIDRRKLQK